jgi:hypothetical protein
VLRKSVGIALFDQAILSLFNLGLNLMLIALAAPSEFGRYIYASAVLLVCTSLQNALVTTPLAVLVPGRPAEQQARVMQGLLSFDVPFRIMCAVVAPLVCLLSDSSPDFLFVVALCVFSALGRETWRTVALTFENPAECLRIDGIAVLGSMAAVAGLWQVCQPAVACIGGVAIGNFAGALLARPTRSSVEAHNLPLHRMSMLAAIASYRREFWVDTQWSLMGAGTTELQYRSYVFTLEFFRETAVLAGVQAGRLLLGPLALVVGAWGKVARPAMARKLAANDPRGMMALTATGMIYVLSVATIYCAALVLLWPLAEQWIFKGRYADIGLMTMAWGGYMLVVIAHMVLSVPLQAAMQLKELAKVTMATACLTGVMLLSLALPVPAVFAVAAMTIGEVVALLWILILVLRLAETRPQRPAEIVSKISDSVAAVGVASALARAEP